MNPSMRNYRDENDYWLIRQFLRDVMLLNGLRELSWGVQRLDYWRWHGIVNMHACAALEPVTFIWQTTDGKIAAFLNPEDSGNAFLQIHPAFKTKDLEEEMVSVAEQHLSIQPDGKRRVAIWVDSQDLLRRSILQSRGYTRGPEAESQWRRDLDKPIPDATVAEGYLIRSLGDANEIPARSWASWRGFHPNEPEGKYQGWQWYHTIQRCPLYRRDLDLVAALPGGEIAAIATFWFDDVTRTVYIEPVATVPEHQRRGLARALITEGLRRVQRLGALRAFVGGYEPGPDSLYSSVLSPQADRSEQWVREW
jgi:mycothiol synthase